MAEVTAMRNNVLAYPVYGLPYVVTFPILDADGDLVTGAAGLDSEVSKNGDTFADCTNEATEIATSSGIYYLLLTATEMTADVVTIIIKTTTTGAKTTTLTLYPVKLPSLLTGTAAAGAAGTITLANASASLAVDDYFNGCLIYTTGGTGSGQARRISDYVGSTRVASVNPQWATTPDNTTTYEIYLTDTAVNALKANVTAISDDATAADNLEAYCDGTTPQPVNTTQIAGAAVSTSTAQIGVNVIQAAGTAWGSGAITAGSIASSAITSAKFASGAITASAIATDAIGAAELAADAVTEIVTGVWNAATASYGGAGTYGQAVEDILADTAELQTDNVDGGRTDLLIDAIKAKTDSLTFTVAGDVDCNVQSWGGSAAPAMTGDAYAIVNNGIYGNNALKALIDRVDDYVDTEIATITSELAKVPKSDSTVTWNATALASIQQECTDALNAYDPPTKAEMDSAFTTTNGKIDAVDDYVDTEVAAIKAVTDKLNTAMELDGAVYRFTLNALERAPSALGAGAITWTYTITDGTNPIEGVDVWVTSDIGGTAVLARGATNASGVVTFYLDAGTVYVWSQKSGYTFTNPDTEVVS